MADDFERGGSPLYGRLARRYADDSLVAEIAGAHEPRWEVPLRLFGGVHYLALAGLASFEDFHGTLEEHADWLARWVAEQPVQTNEVQRSWGLLPGFLTVGGGRPLTLIELGPAAGLNLLWDRYRYRYGDLAWGPPDAPLELTGEVRTAPPARLFEAQVDVRRRFGVDRRPVDVTSEHGARLLEAFVWADQSDRLERVRRAIEVVRRDPPELLAGDYVETLPTLLRERDEDSLTVVFQSASIGYLGKGGVARLLERLEEAGRDGPFGWVSLGVPGENGKGEFVLAVRRWPGGDERRLARVQHHGRWLDWVA
jgi:hypothetical protein